MSKRWLEDKVKVQTLGNTMGNAKGEAPIHKLRKNLAVVKAETLGDTIPDAKAAT